MKCSFCETETTRIVQGPDVRICHDCVRKEYRAAEAAPEGCCAFCHQTIGTKKGLFRRRIIQLVLVNRGTILCTECLEIAKQVVAAES